jgi:hypothetical protein
MSAHKRSPAQAEHTITMILIFKEKVRALFSSAMALFTEDAVGADIDSVVVVWDCPATTGGIIVEVHSWYCAVVEGVAMLLVVLAIEGKDDVSTSKPNGFWKGSQLVLLLRG